MGVPSCVCNKPETVNHIFFKCVFAQYIKCCIRDAFGWTDSHLLPRILSEWLLRRLGVPQRVVMFFFAGLACGQHGRIGTRRPLRRLFLLNPDVVIGTTINFMQMWGGVTQGS
jgi:hypothetical protein